LSWLRWRAGWAGEAAGRFGRQRERSTAEDAEHTEVRARLVWPVRHAGKQAR
jgi:hypothetical protein